MEWECDEIARDFWRLYTNQTRVTTIVYGLIRGQRATRPLRGSGIELFRVSFPEKEQVTHREPKQPDRKIERDPRREREPGVVNGKKAHDRS